MRSFTHQFATDKSKEELFGLLLNVEDWWSGFYDETITGKSEKIGDEFSFYAGGGMHITKQKLIDFVLNEKIVWMVTESNLSFLSEPNEWNNTKLQFELSENADGQTLVRFTHEGLVPEFECFDQCTSAWSQYLVQLEEQLNES